MPVDKRYRMRLLRSTRPAKIERRPQRLASVNVRPTTEEIVRAFRRSRGYDDVVAKIPKAATPAGWDKGTKVAYFSVCAKSGSALWLDLWDCDHFDGFTDMKQSLADCRAWFSHTGFTTWGSAQTATGRINCYFNAASAGNYSCVAQLQSYPATSPSKVECLIDNQSFGPLPFTGTILQPHFSSLSAGGHHFRIRQLSGAFFFLSLTVYSFT
jgi:hypothetical protein